MPIKLKNRKVCIDILHQNFSYFISFNTKCFRSLFSDKSNAPNKTCKGNRVRAQLTTII